MRYLHTMIRVADLARSLDFFQSGLGLIEIRRAESQKGRYTLVYLAAPGDAEAARRADAPLIEPTYLGMRKSIRAGAISGISPSPWTISTRPARGSKPPV